MRNRRLVRGVPLRQRRCGRYREVGIREITARIFHRRIDDWKIICYTKGSHHTEAAFSDARERRFTERNGEI